MTQEQPGELYLMGAWGNRQRSAEQISADLLATLEAFAQIDAVVLTDWVQHSRAALSVDLESVTRLVKLSAMPAEPPGMGWAPAVVSGSLASDRPGVALTLTDGTTSESPIVSGEINVEPTRGWDGDAFLLAHAEPLFDTLVSRWSPDWLAITCLPYLDAQPDGRRRPVIGAVSWLADTLGPLPAPLPDGAQIRPLHQGNVIDLRTQQDALPEVSAVAEVAAWLDRVGVLRDIPQWQQ